MTFLSIFHACSPALSQHWVTKLRICTGIHYTRMHTHCCSHKIPSLQKLSHSAALCLSASAEGPQVVSWTYSPVLVALAAWCMHRESSGRPEVWHKGSQWWGRCTLLTVVWQGKWVAVELCVGPEGRRHWRCCGLWRWWKFVNTAPWLLVPSLAEHPFKQKRFEHLQEFISLRQN